MDLYSHNPEETEAFAILIGKVANAGDIIILSGDLGAGKTTMTKGIAKGLGIDQIVKSPTYTIIREYTQGRIPLYHMDVYRINGEVEDLGVEEYFEGDGLAVVEWGELLDKAMLDSYLSIELHKEEAKNSEKRMISLNAVGKRAQQLLNRIEEKKEARHE